MDKLTKLKDIIKDFTTKNRKLVTILCITLILPIVLLLFTSFSPSNRNLKKLNSLATEIKVANDNLKLAINDKSINPEMSKEILSSSLIELERIKNEITSLDLTDLDKTKNSILEFLNTNINLYKISLDLYSNPKSDRLGDKLKEFSTNLELVQKSSSDLEKIGVIKILSDDSTNFFKFTKIYFDTIIEMNNLTEINNDTKLNFLTSLTSINSKLNKINEDLRPAIEDIYKNDRDNSTLLKDIEEKKNTLNKIREDYFCLSIPEDALKIQTSLQDTLNIYNLYINELEVSINSNSKEGLKNAYSKYDDFTKLYNKYQKDIDAYKNS